jgi:hypothetical protein
MGRREDKEPKYVIRFVNKPYRRRGQTCPKRDEEVVC